MDVDIDQRLITTGLRRLKMPLDRGLPQVSNSHPHVVSSSIVEAIIGSPAANDRWVGFDQPFLVLMTVIPSKFEGFAVPTAPELLPSEAVQIVAPSIILKTVIDPPDINHFVSPNVTLTETTSPFLRMEGGSRRGADQARSDA